MKKLTAVILAVLTVLSCVCLSACENTGVNFYKVSDIKEGKIENMQKLDFLKEYSGSGDAYVCEIKSDAPDSVVVPAKNEKLPVIGVYSAVDPCNGVNNVKIAKGVKYIEKCFNNCEGLRNVDIPSSVESIQDSFIKCPSFESVEVKGDLERLENSFVKCEALSKVTFKGEIKDGLSGKIFNGCKGITSMEFKDNLSSFDIPTSYFSSSIEELSFGGNVGTIAESSFSGCDKLKSVEFDGTVSSIDRDSFSGCKNLETVKFGDSVNFIGPSVFSECIKLETLKFAGKVNSFGVSAFEKCTSLTSLEFPDAVETFNENAFSECVALKSVKLNGKVGTINAGVFSYSKVETLDFKRMVDKLNTGAIDECDRLKQVIFRKKVNTVSEGSFKNCSSLKTIEFKSRVDDLSSSPYSECKSLKKLIVKKFKDIPWYLITNGFNAGTKRMTDFNDKINYKKLQKKAEKKLGKKLPGSKQISYSSARKLAKYYNGPMFYMMFPAKCNYTKFNHKYAKKAGSLHTEYVTTLQYDYPNTVYTDKKARKVIKGKAPLVYCLAERTGYSGPKVYKAINTSKSITRKYYYLHFRFSFWNVKTGKLIAWFNYQAGYAPITYKLSEEYKITRTVDGMGDKRFFLEKDGTSPDCKTYVEKFVFGKKKRYRS